VLFLVGVVQFVVLILARINTRSVRDNRFVLKSQRGNIVSDVRFKTALDRRRSEFVFEALNATNYLPG
jgi:hypothetical protein